MAWKTKTGATIDAFSMGECSHLHEVRATRQAALLAAVAAAGKAAVALVAEQERTARVFWRRLTIDGGCWAALRVYNCCCCVSQTPAARAPLLERCPFYMNSEGASTPPQGFMVKELH